MSLKNFNCSFFNHSFNQTLVMLIQSHHITVAQHIPSMSSSDWEFPHCCNPCRNRKKEKQQLTQSDAKDLAHASITCRLECCNAILAQRSEYSTTYKSCSFFRKLQHQYWQVLLGETIFLLFKLVGFLSLAECNTKPSSLHIKH